MAKLMNYEIVFGKPEGASDIAQYKVYAVPNGSAFTYDLPSVTVDVPVADEEMVFDLSRVITKEGVYDINVTFVDAAGNESDPAVLEDTTVDFTPPAKPVNLRLR